MTVLYESDHCEISVKIVDGKAQYKYIEIYDENKEVETAVFVYESGNISIVRAK